MSFRADDPLLLRKLSAVEKLKLGIGVGVASSGAVAAHTHPASDIVSGTMATARLGSGVADATTFLRGDQTWAAGGGGYTDEQAQDAVGAMVDTTLVYTDATPLLKRAALTGDVTAAAGSNATTIKNDVALAGNPTTTTQAANDNSTRIATTAFVEGEIATHVAAADPHTVYQKESEKGVALGYVGMNGVGYAEPVQLGNAGVPDATTFLNGVGAWAVPAGGSAHGGQATIPFASYLTEDVIAVTGQASLLPDSAITCAVYADNDDVLAQDWWPPVIKSVVSGTGFTLSLRPRVGNFKGNVKVNWNWV